MSSQPRAINNQEIRSSSTARSPFSSSYIHSPIAQASLERDIAESSGDKPQDDSPDSSDDESSEVSTDHTDGAITHAMVSSYRRPSIVAFGGPRPVLAPQFPDPAPLTKKERKQSRNEERSLLRDNHLAPPKHSEPPRRSALNRLYRYLFSTKRAALAPADEEVAGQGNAEPTETSALLTHGGHESARSHHETLNRQWEEAVAAGKIRTTWQREAKTILRYSSSLTVTFILQYSLTVASIFTVGHIGKVELGACALASMTANITGFAIYQGLATSLDTLCAQAYGSGRKHLVGLQMQRMILFLWLLTIPIGIFWYNAAGLLKTIIPEQRSAELAGLYLKILILGAPGNTCFESGKRFVQAQGLFSATTYVLLIAAPLNAFMNWLFVWKFHWGFVGAPIAVVVTENLLPTLLFAYVYFIDGKQCWNGFTKRALHNWGPMINLALPGLVMVEAEFLAFEILTLASSYLGTTELAAQSILITIISLTFQIPFSISVAVSTRVANLIGATLSEAAKTTAKVAFFAACIVGLLNFALLSALRHRIPPFFTNERDVIELVAALIPLLAAFQLLDAFAINCSGLLRGLGKQEIGGYVNLFCYYIIAMPISFGTGFGLKWGLAGLWTGVALALGLVAAIEVVFLAKTDWEEAVEKAQERNSAG